eukprot:gene4255-3077_t
MDSETETGGQALTARLVLLLSSTSGGSLSMSQAASILGVEVPALMHELGLSTSAMRKLVLYDTSQQVVSISAEGKSRLPELLELSRTVPARNSVSDTESHRRPSTSLLKHLHKGGYNSDSNIYGKVRRRGAVRKSRPRIGLTQPPTHDKVGHVGYVCVADEFNLSALENHYRSQGYYTKFDFDVLHVRFADTEMQAQEVPPASYGTEEGSLMRSKGASRTSGDEERPETQGQAVSTVSAPMRSNGFDLFMFEYGAIVWWGFNNRYFKIVETDFMLPQSPIAKFMTNRYSTQIVNENYPVWCTYNLALKETLEIDQDFKELLRFDHFLIPYGRGDPTTCSISMLCASHALAQSAKIDYLEIKVQELTVNCTPLPRELREKGTVTVSERRLLQLRGEVLSYRLMLRSGSDLIDEPSFFWENAYLKPVFQATKECFDISARVEALDNKLDATNEILSMLAEEFSQRHGARLEWIVIWLVFVEVIIGVLELCVDIRPWFR